MASSSTDVAGGVLGSAISTIMLFPLEAVENRQRVDSSFVGLNAVSAMVRIWKEEGMGGLYVGLPASLLGNTLIFFVYFGLWAIASNAITGISQTQKGEYAFTDLVSGIAAGASAAVIMNPIWTVQTRMTMAKGKLSMAQAVSSILQGSGWMGLFAGAGANMLGCIDGAMQWTFTRWAESLLAGSQVEDELEANVVDTSHHFRLQSLIRIVATSLGPWFPFVLAAFARFAAGTIAYPYVVVRTELQVMDANATSVHAADMDQRIDDAHTEDGQANDVLKSASDRPESLRKRPKRKSEAQAIHGMTLEQASRKGIKQMDSPSRLGGNPTIVNALTRVIARDGILGLWTGWSANMIRQVPAAGIMNATKHALQVILQLS